MFSSYNEAGHEPDLNESPRAGQFVGLHLMLPTDQTALLETTVRPGHPSGDRRVRPAIGAVAIVHLADGRRLVAQVDGGSGHSGKRSTDLHFGLGDAGVGPEVQVYVRWRDVEGKPHQKTLYLKPGWHTAILGK